MFDVVRGRWRLFGHNLRLPRDTPANKAMEFYFESSLKNTLKGCHNNQSWYRKNKIKISNTKHQKTENEIRLRRIRLNLE